MINLGRYLIWRNRFRKACRDTGKSPVDEEELAVIFLDSLSKSECRSMLAGRHDMFELRMPDLCRKIVLGD